MPSEKRQGAAALGIGSTVWRFGRNDMPTALRVTSETTRSWVLADGQKVPKSCPDPIVNVSPKFGATLRYCLTREAADAMALERSRWEMAERIKRCTDVATLRTIAATLGMTTGVQEVE
jgi:hypothetical protein